MLDVNDRVQGFGFNRINGLLRAKYRENFNLQRVSFSQMFLVRKFKEFSLNSASILQGLYIYVGVYRGNIKSVRAHVKNVFMLQVKV